MTRGNAHQYLKKVYLTTKNDSYREALSVALFALRPVNRDQVARVWRGEWIGMTDDDGGIWYECSRCEHDLDNLEAPNHFCPACGAPMTDEAMQMVVKRMEALYATAE